MKINMHTSHPSAFISSTFIDLYEDRNEVANTLRERELNVNALDIRPASTQSSRNEILNGIRESDFVILIIGDRFGSIVPKITDSSSLSVTWWEYKKAITFGKPVIAYFQNKEYFNSEYHDDRSEKLYIKKRRLFDRFKKMITEKHNPAYFADSYELAEKIQRCLIPTYRAGVESMNRKNLVLSQTASRLEAENKALKQELANSKKIEVNPFSGGVLGGLGNFRK